MQHILKDVLGNMGDDLVSQMGQKVGLDNSQARSTVEAVVPAILGGLAKNSQDKSGLSSLFAALQKDHDGSVLNQANEVVRDPEQFKASKILSHILGNKEQALAQMIGNSLGTNSGSVDGIMKMAAPMIMGKLGEVTRQYGLSERDLQKLLMVARSDAKKEDKARALAIAFLDKDGDGDIKDDLMSMAGKWIQNKFSKR